MARSGAADQSLKSRRRGYGKTNAKLNLCIYARLTQLEECMVYTHDVGGSSPSLRTIVERFNIALVFKTDTAIISLKTTYNLGL